jgi:hypothetical protein
VNKALPCILINSVEDQKRLNSELYSWNSCRNTRLAVRLLYPDLNGAWKQGKHPHLLHPVCRYMYCLTLHLSSTLISPCVYSENLLLVVQHWAPPHSMDWGTNPSDARFIAGFSACNFVIFPWLLFYYVMFLLVVIGWIWVCVQCHSLPWDFIHITLVEKTCTQSCEGRWDVRRWLWFNTRDEQVEIILGC